MKPGDLEHIKPLNRALLAAWGPDGDPELHHTALRAYLRARSALAPSYRMFEIANHRLFRTETGLLVPYDAHGLLIVFHLEPGVAPDRRCSGLTELESVVVGWIVGGRDDHPRE